MLEYQTRTVRITNMEATIKIVQQQDKQIDKRSQIYQRWEAEWDLLINQG